MRALSQPRRIAKFESFPNSLAVDNESFQRRAVMAFEVAETIQSFQAASNAPMATPSVRVAAVLTLTAALCAQPLLFVIKSGGCSMDTDEMEILDVIQKAIERANIDYPGIEGGRPRDPVLRPKEESRHLALAAMNELHRAGFKILKTGDQAALARDEAHPRLRTAEGKTKMEELEIQDHARQLFYAYGAKATAEAAQKAAALEEKGESDQALIWRRVEAALYEMLGPPQS